MVQASKTISIKTGIDDVFKYVAVPINFLIVLPGLVKVSDVSHSPALKGDHYRWTFRILGVPLQGLMQITEYQKSKLYIAQSSGAATSIWIYELKRLGHRRTGLTLTIEYDYPLAIVKKFATAVFQKTVEKSLDQMLHNLKFVLEGA